MRAGGCTVQQSLTADAATVVKQAVSLARRRGNAQVTPLHVASAMLAAPGGLLRVACLRSHSHPLQCKALELCFNVALNRLPASAAVASSPLLGGHGHGHHYYPPSLSNALVAAFKRAQAHQRRGSVESQQQQPVLAVKIELEQLVVSILDDPSVSRVMREAGFSSTQVKANVEQAVCSTATTSTTSTPNNKPNPNPSSTATASPPQETKTKQRSLLDHVRDDDVAAILDCLASQRKRRLVVVAESTTAAEALARAAVDKIKRAEAKHDALRGARVVSLRVSSFRDMPREETERRLGELRCLVRGRGQQVVLLVVEDLKWAAEFWAGHVQLSGRRGYYCAVEHVVTEVRALTCAGGEHGLCWLVGFGTYQAYMKCRAGQPSLESLWGLETLTVPAGSLALSLTCAFDNSVLGTVNQSMKARPDTDGNGPASCWPLLGGSPLLPRCCGDCSAAARIDAKPAALQPPFVSSSSLPSWLQHCRDHQETTTCLGKTWSSICSAKPSQRMTLHFSAPVSPASSVSSYEQHGAHQPRHSWFLTDLDAKHPWKPTCGTTGGKSSRSNDDVSGPSVGSVEVECRARFKELNAENLKVLCGALEKEVPWQKEIVPEVASTVLQCRSGIAKRRDRSRSTADAKKKEETWMFFLGCDARGKQAVARELANLVFGSHNYLFRIRPGAAASPSPSSASGSSENDDEEQHRRNKRPRTTTSPPAGGKRLGYYYLVDRLYEAVSENPHRVILVEDVDRADRDSEVRVKAAIETGVVRNRDGEEVGLGDAIIILSCENLEQARLGASSSAPPSNKRVKLEMEQLEGKEEHTSSDRIKHDEVVGSSSSTTACFDLNVNAESDQVDDEGNADDGVCLLTAVDRTLIFQRREHP